MVDEMDTPSGSNPAGQLLPLISSLPRRLIGMEMESLLGAPAGAPVSGVRAHRQAHGSLLPLPTAARIVAAITTQHVVILFFVVCPVLSPTERRGSGGVQRRRLVEAIAGRRANRLSKFFSAS